MSWPLFRNQNSYCSNRLKKLEKSSKTTNDKRLIILSNHSNDLPIRYRTGVIGHEAIDAKNDGIPWGA